MWKLAGNLASLAGILGVSASDLIGEQWKPWVALVAFISCMAYITLRAHKVFNRFSKQHYPSGYLPISSFNRYTTLDGKRIQYEVHRHIQVKTAYMKSFEHRFQWTGTKDPVVSSFDSMTKSFSHKIIDPDPGYEYRLTWPRTTVVKKKKTPEREAIAA
jgi:hypothetical protein